MILFKDICTLMPATYAGMNAIYNGTTYIKNLLRGFGKEKVVAESASYRFFRPEKMKHHKNHLKNEKFFVILMPKAKQTDERIKANLIVIQFYPSFDFDSTILWRMCDKEGYDDTLNIPWNKRGIYWGNNNGGKFSVFDMFEEIYHANRKYRNIKLDMYGKDMYPEKFELISPSNDYLETRLYVKGYVISLIKNSEDSPWTLNYDDPWMTMLNNDKESIVNNLDVKPRCFSPFMYSYSSISKNYILHLLRETKCINYGKTYPIELHSISAHDYKVVEKLSSIFNHAFMDYYRGNVTFEDLGEYIENKTKESKFLQKYIMTH